MKKLLTIMTAFVLALVVAMPVFATTNGASVEDATAPDSYKEDKPTPGAAVKTGTETDEIFTLTYDSASLKLVHNGEGEENRPDNNAWIGVKVTAPSDAKSFKVEQDTKLGNTPAIDASKLTSTFENGGTTFHEYFHVNESELKDAVKNKKAYITYALKYTWKYNGQGIETNKVKTTTVVVKIKVEGVTLVDEKTGEEETDETLWNKQKYDEEVAKVKAQTSNKTTTTTTNNKKKDPTPGTGVENVYAVAGLLAIVSLAGIVVLNKRK